MTGIEWTDRTHNPVTGCDKVSPGCKNCYAETLAKRLQAAGNPRYTQGFKLTLHPDKIDEPRSWAKGTWVFVNSMSDLLHRDVPDGFLLRQFRMMSETPRHRYQVLTKRPERWASVTEMVVRELGAWPGNVLPGTSIENRAVIDGSAVREDGRQKVVPRLQALGRAGDENTVRMISAEPLLGSLLPEGGTPADLAADLTAARIGWVITGGESAFPSRYRASDLDWFREVRDACAIAGIPFFHKQHGGPGVTKAKKRGGAAAVLDGVLHHAMPSVFGHSAAPSKLTAYAPPALPLVTRQ